MKRAEADERLGELPEPDLEVALLEARLDHHLLAVVRPALDGRRWREEERLPQLRFDLPQVQRVHEVARIRLVHRDRPERGGGEVAQVLGLPLDGPRRGRRR